MLPILIAEGSSANIIVKILGLKLIIGIFFGFVIELIFKNNKKITDFHICNESHCDCHNSLIKSSLVHTMKTFLFILVITFILNTLFYIVGEDTLKNLVNNNWYAPFISSLIGLIPNCATSVALTELYLNEVIPLGTAMAGLLTSSGVALLVLFKSNKNLKENIFIVLLMYFVGSVSGLTIQFLGL